MTAESRRATTSLNYEQMTVTQIPKRFQCHGHASSRHFFIFSLCIQTAGGSQDTSLDIARQGPCGQSSHKGKLGAPGGGDLPQVTWEFKLKAHIFKMQMIFHVLLTFHHSNPDAALLLKNWILYHRPLCLGPATLGPHHTPPCSPSATTLASLFLKHTKHASGPLHMPPLLPSIHYMSGSLSPCKMRFLVTSERPREPPPPTFFPILA